MDMSGLLGMPIRSRCDGQSYVLFKPAQTIVKEARQQQEIADSILAAPRATDEIEDKSKPPGRVLNSRN
jgi:hypothetical protein